MTRLIKESILDEICCYRAVRMKKDSHFEGEYYCRFPPQDFGNEPVCKYQCTKEIDNEKDII